MRDGGFTSTKSVQSAAVLALLCLAACGGGQQAASLEQPPAAAAVTARELPLPALGALGAPAHQVAAVEQYKFTDADIVDSAAASMTGEELTLDGSAGLSYALLGVNIAGRLPQRLIISGTLSAVYAVAPNYLAGTWRLLTDGLSGPISFDLPTEYLISPGDSLYVALVCAAGGMADVSLAVEFLAVQDDTWNFMVWMSGDNDLAASAFEDIQEMESVGSSDNVRVFAGYDIDPGYLDFGATGADEVRFIKVVQDSDPLSINTSGDPQNQSFLRTGYNSADPVHVREFVDWVNTNFPAGHSTLVLWDHGDGWLVGGGGSGPARKHRGGGRETSGILGDDSDGTWDLTPNAAVADALAGCHFDLLLFDACLMCQIESCYDYRDLAYYILASEVLVPDDGYPYDEVLSDWNAGFPLSEIEIGEIFVNRVKTHYTATGENVQHSLIYAGNLAGLAPALYSFASAVTAKAVEESANIKQAISDAYEPYGGSGVRDLRAFLDSYRALTSNPGIQMRIEGVEGLLNGLIINAEQFQEPETRGIAIWLPDSNYFTADLKAQYATLAFAADTHWLQMLEATGVPGQGVQFDWVPGDRLEVDWGDAQADFNLEFTDPGGNYGSTFYPGPLAGIIDFSQDSYDSGLAVEWGKLHDGAPAGIYSATLFYSDYAAFPPDFIFVLVKLYDSGGSLKQDLGTLQVGGFDIWTTLPLADLAYTLP